MNPGSLEPSGAGPEPLGRALGSPFHSSRLAGMKAKRQNDSRSLPCFCFTSSSSGSADPSATPRPLFRLLRSFRPEDTAEALSCPADSKRNTGSGYQTLADSLLNFSQIGCLPKSLDLSRLDDARATKTTVDEQDDINHGIALGELVSYIDDARMDALVAPVFKLVDLTRLYTTRLEQLGTVLTGRVHSTKLKDRIITYFPDLEEHKSGRDIMLAFNQDVGSALQKACEHDADSEGVCLARAANIVRRDMLKMKTTFSGSFETHCQEQSVPTSLVALVAMILNGPNIQEQSCHSSVSTATLTVSQLLMFNSYAHHRESTSTTESTRHSHNRETPLPVYLGTLIHTKTRKRDLVDTLFHLGLSISYDRVLSISTDLGDRICRFFQKEGTVCPPELKSGLFTTGAVDNIDHNPSSTSAQDSFHGTGISLFQHPNSDSRGVQRVVPDDTATSAAHLPQSYTIVPPVVRGKCDPPVPKLAGPNKSDCQLIPQAMQMEYRWLEQMEKTVISDTPLQGDETVSWAAYHASKQSIPEEPECSVTLTSLLPLFYDQAKSVAMIRHSMDVVKRAVDILNPGVASTGTADSFLKAAHVTRTRRAHQVTASSLYLLLKEAYSQYTSGLEEGQDPMPLDDWCAERVDASPQFQFWFIILQLELAVLIYVRSVREENFLLYTDALSKLVPWFFALGHTNYARWIPVHLRDMVTLVTKHPSVYAQFLAGNFTVKKTTHAFSAIALDQAHEQNNALVKGDGGAVGLTENPAALRRWMVSGPEMARLISEFQATTEKRMKKTELKHHEQTKHTQVAFARDVRALTRVMGEMGNPFCEDSKDLLVLDSRDLADPAVINTLHQIEKLGQEQYDTYVNERLVHQTKPITDPIKRNNLHIFSRPPVREKSRTQFQVLSLKNDCSLFSRLFIASQTRDGDLDEFFAHENQACPLHCHKWAKSDLEQSLIWLGA
ncbi:hypothetical protein AAFF_G00019150 [Aldrovandia affinis]|uniref:Uncharacterized protein n=1 Tax=Aldrovandia affinis TaxID=143900 RepID=A0AAD7S5I6_9TELE|nr:hypothetical protein AAFF_G00019150 [Aldrovandia affinis]